MNIQIVSKAGECHDFDPEKNEDAVSSLVGERYAFFCISDGAGSSQYAKDAAWTTVNTVMKCCNDYGSELFESETDIAQKRLIFDIQQALYNKAKEINTDISKMMCTLVLLCLDMESKQYVTVHVGDGLVARQTHQEIEIISYPENGITKQFTYFVNAKNVFDHLYVEKNDYIENDGFFIGSDGVFEQCSVTQEYQERIAMHPLIKNSLIDDATYCQLNLNVV